MAETAHEDSRDVITPEATLRQKLGAAILLSELAENSDERIRMLFTPPAHDRLRAWNATFAADLTVLRLVSDDPGLSFENEGWVASVSAQVNTILDALVYDGEGQPFAQQ